MVIIVFSNKRSIETCSYNLKVVHVCDRGVKWLSFCPFSWNHVICDFGSFGLCFASVNICFEDFLVNQNCIYNKLEWNISFVPILENNENCLKKFSRNNDDCLIIWIITSNNVLLPIFLVFTLLLILFFGSVAFWIITVNRPPEQKENNFHRI